MKKINHVQFIEQFHLLFLDQLGRKIDKNLYALKGGCNLRFFLKSIRYSQDIDFDIQIVREDTLRKAVNGILKSASFTNILCARGMAIQGLSEPKQTETTQRWKLGLSASHSSFPLNTKIEFSRRKWQDPVVFESIDPLISQSYQLTPIFANHYTAASALSQKIEALALRNQTQSRDVFDIFHLIRMGVTVDCSSERLHALLSDAASNALGLSFGDFTSQVVAYLPYEYHEQYQDPTIWENMVLEVVRNLQHEDH